VDILLPYKPDNSGWRVALALSLLFHVLVILPLVAPELPLRATEAPMEEQVRENVTVLYVDPQPGPAAPPSEEIRLVSTRSSRAAQPEAPTDRPQGAAFQEGRTRLPATPRAPGPPAGGDSPSPERAAQPLPDVASTTMPEEERNEEKGTRAETDPRLIIPRRPLGMDRPPGASGSGDRLPAPQVDQRLTRATAGSTFSLNTTAWDYAPYLARLKAEIEEHISPPVAFYYGIAAWSTRVRFRIARDGRLTELVLLDHRGVKNLQHVALDAVQGAADFEPLPPSFPEPYLEITGGFYFNVIPGETPP
jgi:hypothetical protein